MLDFRFASAKLSAFGPLRKLRVQAISDCLVEPEAVSHLLPHHKQKYHLKGGIFVGIGGAGGNRTRVRKPSTDSSTYLAWLLSLILHPPTDKRLQNELP